MPIVICDSSKMDGENKTAIEENVLIIFSWYDYTLFLLMLGMSALIGIYFGFFGQKQSSPDEYLLGGKKMKVFPIALSITASAISGTTFLAVPTETYRFGSTYIFHLFTVLGVLLITNYIYLPVFYKLQLTSTYEYLELRFNAQLRLLSSFIFAISTILFLPIVIYAPALAFSQATGTNIYYVAILVSVTCIFYTTIGGLKAVVWTDALQFVVMLGAALGVAYMGIVSVGGIGQVFKTSYYGDRLSYDLDWDPSKRDTVWAIMLGSHFTLLVYMGIGQGYIQKYLSLPQREDVRKAMIWFALGGNFVLGMAVFTGLLIYAKYADCDPFSAGKISKQDQILPLYIMEVSKTVPGLAGLYLSGLFSAALSSLSACMNCLSGTLYEDFISPFMPKDISKKSVSNILKLLVFVVGTIGTALIFVIEKMGSILPIQFSLMGITGGTLLGLFSLGMMVPMANTKGASAGAIGSLLIMCFIVIKSQIYRSQGFIHYSPKPISIEGCEYLINNITTATLAPAISSPDSEPSIFFRITHYYYTMLGTIIFFLIAIPVSYLTKNENTDKPVNKDLITPVMQWLCKKESGHEDTKYYSVDKALNVVYNNEKGILKVELKNNS